MKETTLKEIAETLGISITTVSKALKNYSDVSEKTRKAVIALAEELNYTPNSFAVNLRTKESKTIGLIIPEVVHHFFFRMSLMALLPKQRKKAISLLFYNRMNLWNSKKNKWRF